MLSHNEKKEIMTNSMWFEKQLPCRSNRSRPRTSVIRASCHVIFSTTEFTGLIIKCSSLRLYDGFCCQRMILRKRKNLNNIPESANRDEWSMMYFQFHTSIMISSGCCMQGELVDSESRPSSIWTSTVCFSDTSLISGEKMHLISIKYTRMNLNVPTWCTTTS